MYEWFDREEFGPRRRRKSRIGSRQSMPRPRSKCLVAASTCSPIEPRCDFGAHATTSPLLTSLPVFLILARTSS